MTCALQSDHAGPRGSSGIPPKISSRSRILKRVLHAISGWDQAQADQEIGRMLTRSGGRLTDDLERRMMQRVMTSNWGSHG